MMPDCLSNKSFYWCPRKVLVVLHYVKIRLTLRSWFHWRFSHVMFQYSHWVYVINIHEKQPGFPEKTLGLWWIYTACHPVSMSEWLLWTRCADTTGVRKIQAISEEEGPENQYENLSFAGRYICSFSVWSAHSINPVSTVYGTSFNNELFDILTNHRYIPMCQISLRQLISAWITLMHFYLIQGKEADT